MQIIRHAHRRTAHRPALLLALTVSLLLAVGCTAPGQPRLRAGSLPYPGLLTLYQPFDPDNVDDHSYGPAPLFKNGTKGIVYTEQAGFIDMAHIRWTVDWSWYYQQHIRDALREGRAELVLPTNKFSRFNVELAYPDDWDERSVEQREAVIDRVALRFAQELSYLLGHWHEIATFYGHATLVVISEYESAFAYDDTFSHVVGLYVFEQAMSDQDNGDFDAAVTLALHQIVALLEPRSPEGTREAIDVVHGRWWDKGKMVRRYLDLGMEGDTVRPWLIPHRQGEPGRHGPAWTVPGLHDLEPAERAMVAGVRIRPRIFEAGDIRRAARLDAGPVDPYAHFPHIMDDIRHRHYAQHGPDTAQP